MDAMGRGTGRTIEEEGRMATRRAKSWIVGLSLGILASLTACLGGVETAPATPGAPSPALAPTVTVIPAPTSVAIQPVPDAGTSADLDPARIVATISLPIHPDQIVADADAVWVLDREAGVVVRTETATNQIAGPPIRLDFSPWSLTTGAGAVWITGNGADIVARLDPTTNRITATFPVPSHPIAQAALGFGALWTANAGGTTVSRLDLRSGGVTSFRAGHQPHGIAVGAGAVWVANHDESAVVRVDTDTRQIRARIHVSSEPHSLLFAAGYLWADGYHVDGIQQIDPQTNQTRNGIIPLGFPSDVFAGDATGIWIASVPTERNDVRAPGTRQVVRIDPGTGQVVERLTFAAPPMALALDAYSLWVALQDPPALVRIRR
jgi:streptogramin lyase